MMKVTQAQFATMMNDYADMLAHSTASGKYIDQLVSYCSTIAAMVLKDVVSDFGTPLHNEVLELAKNTTNPVARCAVLLQHSVSNGVHYGLTFKSLMDQMVIPTGIIHLAEILTRRTGESYGAHHQRLIEDHSAVKLMIAELIARADISKYRNPTKENHIRCCGLLDRAMVLKNYPDYYRREEETLCDILVDVDQVTDLVAKINQNDPHAKEIEYYFSGGIIPIGKCRFVWSDGVVTANLFWDSSLVSYFNNQQIVLPLPLTEFGDFVAVHYSFYAEED